MSSINVWRTYLVKEGKPFVNNKLVSLGYEVRVIDFKLFFG